MRWAALVLSLLVIAGCGGDEESAAPPAAASPASTEAPSASAKKTVVDIKDFTFTPGDVTVSPGAEVTFANADSSNHNVQFADDAVEGIANLREGQEGSVSFDEPGSFKYVCTYHPGMKGTVVVK